MADFSAQPINYSSDVATPFASAMQGYAGGAQIRGDQMQQQQQQIAMQQQQQQYQALSALANNPNATGADYARVMTAMPQLAEPLAKGWATLNDAQQQSHMSDLLKQGAAIQSGHPEVAADIMTNQADAIEASNGGQPTSKSQALRIAASHTTTNPAFTYGQIQAQLSAFPKAKDAATALSTLGGEARAEDMAPSALLKGRADASTAVSDATIKGVQAGNAPNATNLENQTKEEGILTAQAQRQVNAMNVGIAQANSETERGRLTLERDKYVQEQKLLTQGRGNAAQDTMDGIGSSLSTINQALKHPGLESWLGDGTMGSIARRQAQLIPGTDAHNFGALIDTVKSQQFMDRLNEMKAASGGSSTGIGRIMQSEVGIIQNAVGNLDTSQSSDQIRKNLQTIQEHLLKAQQKLVANNPALPTSGGAMIMKHPVYGNVTDGDVNRLMTQFPGSTRQQVLQYLQSSGGK